MDILAFAMEKERQAEALYRELQGRTDNEGLKSILDMLARAEHGHFVTLEQMKEKLTSVPDSELLENARQLFVKMRQRSDTFDLDIRELDLYQQAQEWEKQSIDLYQDCADKAQSEEEKALFLRLRDEEKKHFFLLDNIIRFVSHPDIWVENAEFNHILEPY